VYWGGSGSLSYLLVPGGKLRVGGLQLGARWILLKETGQIIDLWPSTHLRLPLLLNIPSSKRNRCIGKQRKQYLYTIEQEKIKQRAL